MPRFVILLCLSIVAVGAFAADGTNGRYQTADGYYVVDVSFGPGTLTVVEPNKTSVYHWQGDAYHFTNPVNGIAYAMKVLDARTLLAFKPGREHDGTRLNLAQAAASASSPRAAPTETPAYRKYMQAAERYKTLAQEDRIKAQIWSACSAAALTYAQKPKAEAADHARRTVAMLKTIMLYPEETPCADVLDADIWRSID